MSEQKNPQSFLPLPHLPLHILLALAEGDAAHGWAVIKRISEMTEGSTDPSTGSLYLAMVRLEERGLLTEVDAPSDDVDARRKYYRITRLGRSVLAAETRRLAGLVKLAQATGLSGGRE